LNGLEARADRLAVIHRHADPLGPIEMPLSSLASGVPTQAVSSVCQLRGPPSNRADPQGQMIELPAEIFAKPMRKDVLHRCVVWYLANLRQVSTLLLSLGVKVLMFRARNLPNHDLQSTTLAENYDNKRVQVKPE
jgi:hypothetical protein